MLITNDKVVSVSYELKENNNQGTVLETVGADKPLTFLFGAGNLLAKFEENLDGLKTGEKFQFMLDSKEAYGEIDESAIVDIPKSIFMKDGQLDKELLAIGNQIPMRDKNGNHFTGIVQEVAEESVKMDFNHPLAGTNLFFSGEVVAVREASQDELKHQHAHNPDACKGCSQDDCSHNE